MGYVATAWAYREVVTSSKLQQMCDNDEALKAFVQGDAAWATVGASFAAGWSGYTGALTGGVGNWTGCRYVKRAGMVYVAGAVNKSSALVAGEIIFTLPAGYAPAVPIPGGPGTSITVRTDGTVRVEAPVGTTFPVYAAFPVASALV